MPNDTDFVQQFNAFVDGNAKVRSIEVEVARLDERVKTLEGAAITQSHLKSAENRVTRWLIGTVLTVAGLIVGGLLLYVNLSQQTSP